MKRPLRFALSVYRSALRRVFSYSAKYPMEDVECVGGEAGAVLYHHGERRSSHLSGRFSGANIASPPGGVVLESLSVSLPVSSWSKLCLLRSAPHSKPDGEIDPGTSDHFNYNTQELHPDRSNTEGVSFILLGIHKMQYYSREDVLT